MCKHTAFSCFSDPSKPWEFCAETEVQNGVVTLGLCTGYDIECQANEQVTDPLLDKVDMMFDDAGSGGEDEKI